MCVLMFVHHFLLGMDYCSFFMSSHNLLMFMDAVSLSWKVAYIYS